MSEDFITVQFDQKSVAGVTKMLAKYDKKGIADRLNKGTLAALKLLVPAVQGDAPVGTSGNLRRKVKATARKGGGATLTSSDPVRHLVIRGHRVVTPGGRYLGRSTKANPFIDRAAQPRMEQAMAEVQKILFGD